MSCATFDTCAVFSAWRYSIEVMDWGGTFDAKFWKVSEISMEVEIEEMYRGGSGIADKYPGRGKTEPITFEKGATTDTSDIQWFEKVANFPSGKFGSQCGALGDKFKYNIKVNHHGQDCGDPLMTHIVHNAWPHKIVFGELDNNTSDKVIRKLTMVFDWVETDALGGGKFQVPAGQLQ